MIKFIRGFLLGYPCMAQEADNFYSLGHILRSCDPLSLLCRFSRERGRGKERGRKKGKGREKQRQEVGKEGEERVHCVYYRSRTCVYSFRRFSDRIQNILVGCLILAGYLWGTYAPSAICFILISNSKGSDPKFLYVTKILMPFLQLFCKNYATLVKQLYFYFW